jgi:hypothetical protein
MAVQSAPFTRLRTPGLAGYNLAWSPFYPDRLAVAGAANVSPIFLPGASNNTDASIFSMALWGMGG